MSRSSIRMHPLRFRSATLPSRSLTALLVAASLLSGCSLIDAKKDDYKRANRLPPLEIPPSLSVPQADDRYTIPDPKDVAASATYSEYAKSRGLPTLQAGYVPGVGVDPQSAMAHIEHAGAERWLVVNGSTDQVFNTVRTFLTENGYEIGSENPQLGVLETQWLTGRPEVEDDGILRNLVKNLFASDNANAIRDRYRFRVDHGRKAGTAEIFVYHKGLEEVEAGTDRTVWQARASEPDKEAEMLKRLLLKFGVDIPKADEQIKGASVEPRPITATADDVKTGSAAPMVPMPIGNAAPSAPPAGGAALAVGGTTATAGGAGSAASSAAAAGLSGAAAVLQPAMGNQPPALVVPDAFDRAWRRVGLALEQTGIQVQDQDRDEGIYFVQYVADKVKVPGAIPNANQGFLGLISGIGKSIWNKMTDTDTNAKADGRASATIAVPSTKVPDALYRLVVSKKDGGTSRVTLLDKTGQPLASDVASSLLAQVAGGLR